MAEAPAIPHGLEHEETSTGLNHRKLLMWAFLGSDCMFFGSLIGTYLVYQDRSKAGPFPEDVFSIPTTSVSTFVLLMSSMSMVLAYSALTRGSIKGFRIWVLSTALLGMTFIAFQVFEFRTFANHEIDIDCARVTDSKYFAELTEYERTFVDQCGAAEFPQHHGLTLRTNLFGSTFYTLTGFHGAHVTLGVVWLLSLFFFSFTGGVTAKRNLDVDLAALYWHFVDVVWIVIFAVVYLIGVFPGF